MYQPISTKTHGILDYLTIGTFFALPRLLGWSKPLTNTMTAIAATKLGYTLLTRHELGAAKIIPMKAHLALDGAVGASLCALPFAMDEDDIDAGAPAMLISMGLFDIAAAPLTQTQAPFDAPAQDYPTPTNAYLSTPDHEAATDMLNAGRAGS